MPLATTLRAVDIGYKRSRIDLGGTLLGDGGWQFRLDARHDKRDGTQRGAGSFFSSTSQLVLPLDQTTDQIEAVAEYADKRLQASIGYRGSMFRNGDDQLNWQNPFTPIAGATSGQLALAPDNEFHEVFGTVGYQFTPLIRASGELAMGRMTQDQSFLPSTANPTLAVAALPTASLDGHVDTLDATLRLTAAPMERLRLAASLIRNERDNKTSSLQYQQVSTDMFVGPLRANMPYSFTRDRAKLEADWRGNGGWKLAGGIDYDALERTLQETQKTNETTIWARGSVQPVENLGLALKLLHGERDNDGYAVVPSATPQNPLMRKYNQADRRRNLVEARADWAVVEGSSLSFNLDITDDDYTDSIIGLTGAYSASVGVDLATSLSEDTQLRAYAQSEQIKSAMANSQQFAQPDWRGYGKDQFNTFGVGVTHNAMKGKLELGGDLTVSRSHSTTTILLGTFSTSFPTVKTSLDSVTLRGVWHQSAKLALLGSIAYEHYDSKNWQLDGILPGTVPNLLAFGEQAPRYNAGVIRMAVRYSF
jgi:MtrB/PioB family decaheme-associated outer membrane protein